MRVSALGFTFKGRFRCVRRDWEWQLQLQCVYYM